MYGYGMIKVLYGTMASSYGGCVPVLRFDPKNLMKKHPCLHKFARQLCKPVLTCLNSVRQSACILPLLDLEPGARERLW